MKLLKYMIICSLVLLSAPSMAEISVIVNAANNDVLDNKMVTRIFLGKAKSFPNGNKVVIFSLADNLPETGDFHQKALKKSSSQFKSYWSKLAFTGKGTPPKSFNSAIEMINAVKNDANAIGFISSEQVTSDVKVIATY